MLSMKLLRSSLRIIAVMGILLFPFSSEIINAQAEQNISIDDLRQIDVDEVNDEQIQAIQHSHNFQP